MRLIDPSFEIINQPTSGDPIINAKKQIEIAARTCYKSEDKITDDSYESMYERLLKSGHTSCLEHGTIYLYLEIGSPLVDSKYEEKSIIVKFFTKNKYSKVVTSRSNLNGLATIPTYYITTNLRVIEEQFPFGDGLPKWDHHQLTVSREQLKSYIVNPQDVSKFSKRISVKFICDRAIATQILRHRVFSFAMQSQRYCNYSKGKFGNEITFIKPEYEGKYPKFREILKQTEEAYLYLLSIGWKPEQARKVLPNATATEVFVTGFLDDWEWFFDLRARFKFGKPDEEMLRLSEPLRDKFRELWYIK